MEKKSGLIGNLFWKFAERITAQFVTLIVSVVLVRILEPSHYGIIAIVEIFITLANVLVSDGFGSALIQKKDADELDFASVFYFNLGFSIFLYCCLFIAAPYIANFYGKEYAILVPVLRVLGIRIIISGINSVQQAYVSRHMIFKKFFWATLFGTSVSAVVGIIMAITGFGVWALVAQYLTNTIVDTIVLNLSIKFKPIRKFSWNRLKSLLNYGIKILATSMLISFYQELRALIVGKVYSSSDLAFYDKGKQFPSLIIININTSISAVLFPKMSQQQDNLVLVKETARKLIKFSSFFMCPMMVGLAVVADAFVSVVLTDKWLPCVPLLRLFCIVYLFQPIHSANMQAIKAIGRSDVYLKLEIIKKTIELASLLFVMKISVKAIVISMAVLTFLFTFVNAYPNIKLLNYGIREQIKDIFPSLGMSGIMALLIFPIQMLQLPKVVILVMQVIVGIVIYSLIALLTKNEQFFYILRIIKRR